MSVMTVLREGYSSFPTQVLKINNRFHAEFSNGSSTNFLTLSEIAIEKQKPEMAQNTGRPLGKHRHAESALPSRVLVME